MDIKANARRSYILKFVLIGLSALAFGLWNLKDATITYPAQRPHADAYLAMQGPPNENGDYMISDGDLQEAWTAYAEPRGLPITKPDMHDHLDFLIKSNYFIGGVFSLLGLWCLGLGLPTIGKWIELKDGTVSTKGGTGIALKDITAIDKTRWEKKGIAKVSATDANGKLQTVTIDDLKFDREPTDQIMAEIERVAGEDKITAGKPESEYKILQKEKEAKRLEREQAMNDMDDE